MEFVYFYPRTRKQTMTDTIKSPYKPGTLIHFINELGVKEPKMGAQAMHEAGTKAGFTSPITTYHAIRSQLGFRERNRATPPNTKSAAPAPKKPAGKRGPYKKKNGKAKASNGHTAAPSAPAAVVASADLTPIDAFRQLVKRIGTDAAFEHLKQLEQVM